MICRACMYGVTLKNNSYAMGCNYVASKLFVVGCAGWWLIAAEGPFKLRAARYFKLSTAEWCGIGGTGWCDCGAWCFKKMCDNAVARIVCVAVEVCSTKGSHVGIAVHLI